LLGGACSGDDDAAEQPAVLDNARAAAEGAAGAVADEETDRSEDTPGDVAADLPNPSNVLDVDELPAPDPSDYEGANRVVNLWVGPGGSTRAIDVWGRRTFTNGPILLAEGIPFGAASDYFSAPLGYSLSVVGSGAGPDGDELSGLFNATDGEQITMIYTNEDEVGGVWSPNLWEVDPGDRPGVPEPPKPGMGLVYLYAANTFAFDDALIASVGSDSFYVGDGAGACRPQRVEDLGFQANILGGTQNVQLDLPPGPATITLHPWLSPAECAQPAALELVVDVPADGSVMVLIYTTDGQTLEALQLPIA
jgi:hypothetical protein